MKKGLQIANYLNILLVIMEVVTAIVMMRRRREKNIYIFLHHCPTSDSFLASEITLLLNAGRCGENHSHFMYFSGSTQNAVLAEGDKTLSDVCDCECYLALLKQ